MTNAVDFTCMRNLSGEAHRNRRMMAAKGWGGEKVGSGYVVQVVVQLRMMGGYGTILCR